MGSGRTDGKRCGLTSLSTRLLRFPLIIELSELLNVEAERRMTWRRAADVERDENELRVEELGVEGLMREGTCAGRGGDEDRRFI